MAYCKWAGSYLTCFYYLCADCICWAKKIQCKFPACIPNNKGNDILDFCLHIGNLVCA